MTFQDIYHWAELNLYGILGWGVGGVSAGIGIESLVSKGISAEGIAATIAGIGLAALSSGKIARQLDRYALIAKKLENMNPENISPQLYERFMYAPCTRRSVRLALRDNVNPEIWYTQFRPQYPVRCAFKHIIDLIPKS